MSKRACTPTLFLFILGVAATTPAALHSQGSGSITRQWQHSPHARSMDTPDERERMNRPGCARCHTAQGFHEVILEGRESTAPYTDPVGLTCQACHGEGEGPNRVGPLRAGSARDACGGCHDELVTNRPDDLSWCSQWGIFEGTGGAEISGNDYEDGTHTGLEKGCVACHMAPAAEDQDGALVGGHTFRVKTKDQSPVAFNPSACLECHGSMALDQVTASQEKVTDLLATLSALLPQRPDPESPGATVPRFPADPSLDETQRRASHNFWLVQKDGSLGVHNPAYTRSLLEESIASLRRRPEG